MRSCSNWLQSAEFWAWSLPRFQLWVQWLISVINWIGNQSSSKSKFCSPKKSKPWNTNSQQLLSQSLLHSISYIFIKICSICSQNLRWMYTVPVKQAEMLSSCKIWDVLNSWGWRLSMIMLKSVKDNKVTCDKSETIFVSNMEHYSEACNNSNHVISNFGPIVHRTF